MPQSIACKSLYCSLRWAAEATEKNDGSKSLYCSLRWVEGLQDGGGVGLYVQGQGYPTFLHIAAEECAQAGHGNPEVVGYDSFLDSE